MMKQLILKNIKKAMSRKKGGGGTRPPAVFDMI